MTDKQENPQDMQPEKPLIDIKTGNHTVDESIVRVSRFATWFQSIPAVRILFALSTALMTDSAASLAQPLLIFHFYH